MNLEYYIEGYSLMMSYLKENKILTKERNFRKRLDNWYKRNKDSGSINDVEQLKYLKLEQYFYNNILSPESEEEKVLTNFLNNVVSNEGNKEI